MDEFPECQSFRPKSLKGTPVTLHLDVEDVDTAFKRAVMAGAKSRMPVEETFWGDRYGMLVDPFGHTGSSGRAIDRLRSDEVHTRKYRLWRQDLENWQRVKLLDRELGDDDIGPDRLRLVFTAADPVLSRGPVPALEAPRSAVCAFFTVWRRERSQPIRNVACGLGTPALN